MSARLLGAWGIAMLALAAPIAIWNLPSARVAAALILIAYALAAGILDPIAHGMVYPVVGNGYPLTGRNRWTVRMFSPVIFVVVMVVCAPIGILAVLAAASEGRR
jgi:hypothetical protein